MVKLKLYFSFSWCCNTKMTMDKAREVSQEEACSVPLPQ